MKRSYFISVAEARHGGTFADKVTCAECRFDKQEHDALGRCPASQAEAAKNTRGIYDEKYEGCMYRVNGEPSKYPAARED